MARACHEVLRPGGRMAGYTIHPRGGLDPPARARAAELGPSEVLADTSPGNRCESAGFVDVRVEDVTDEFGALCRTILRAWRGMEEELRTSEGDEAYDEEIRKKSNMLLGVEEGLLRRSLVVARRPAREAARA